MLFADRAEAGERLADRLLAYAGRPDVIVLALPRGGVPVAFAVARRLGLPLDVFIVRKLGVPGHEELAMGAIASGGVRVVNERVIAQLPDAQILLGAAAERELRELARREKEYRENRPAPDLPGKAVILVDDGLATGSTMRAAVQALRQCAVARIVVAVPVGPPDTCAELAREVDEAICLWVPESFCSVGQFYRNFAQTTDEEVRSLLARATMQEASP